MVEKLELDRVLDELKAQGVDVQVENTSDDLFQIIDGGNSQCWGVCSQWGCSGGSGFRAPESFLEDEKMAA